MNALEILISDYLSANNHLRSDGYHNPDAEKVVQAAREQHAALFSVCEAIATDDWDGLIAMGRNLGANFDWHGYDDLNEYKYAGDFETDARHTYPNRDKLIFAVLAAVIAKVVSEPQEPVAT